MAPLGDATPRQGPDRRSPLGLALDRLRLGLGLGVLGTGGALAVARLLEIVR